MPMIQETLLGRMKTGYESQKTTVLQVDLTDELVNIVRIVTDGGVFVYGVTDRASTDKYSSGLLVCLRDGQIIEASKVSLQGSVGENGILKPHLLLPKHYLQYEQLKGRNGVLMMQSTTRMKNLLQI
jgi:membrane-bound inhibitor of C-type lysozyme